MTEYLGASAGSESMSQELVRQRKRMMAKLLGAITTLMVAPPVIAGLAGSLGLAVVVGVLSIFAGLVGMSVVVSKWEFFECRADAAVLPRARLLEPKR